jgi:hypothetical protein
LTIDFGCVLSYLDKKLNKGEKMTEVIWKEKKYVIPFDVNLEWDKNKR